MYTMLKCLKTAFLLINVLYLLIIIDLLDCTKFSIFVINGSIDFDVSCLHVYMLITARVCLTISYLV